MKSEGPQFGVDWPAVYLEPSQIHRVRLPRVQIDLHDPERRVPLIPQLLLLPPNLFLVDPPGRRTARLAYRTEGLLAMQVGAALVQLHPVGQVV